MTDVAGWRVWVAGARPRTLGAAVSPVLVGTAVGAQAASFAVWRAVGALVVAVALQVGVNYANDYSDGVRGTDDKRRGPVRLVASGLASPRAVLLAAGLAFGVAAVVGLWLCLVTEPLLLLVGAAAIVAAWTYTGGPKPYGYSGWGEVAVLVFFGFVATIGSAYVQAGSIPAAAWPAAFAAGLPACAILLANNIRDVPTDTVAGKRTLAVRVGARRARKLYVTCLAGAFVAVGVIAVWAPFALIALAAAPLAVRPARAVLGGAEGRALIGVLGATGLVQLAIAVLLAVGVSLS